MGGAVAGRVVDVCMSVDPVATWSSRGRPVHRHCLRHAGHPAPHITVNRQTGEQREWWWEDDELEQSMRGGGPVYQSDDWAIRPKNEGGGVDVQPPLWA